MKCGIVGSRVAWCGHLAYALEYRIEFEAADAQGRGDLDVARTLKGGKTRRSAKTPPRAETYRHPEAQGVLRPEVGTQAQFRKKKPPATYRYDSSLSPALDWDGQNAAREQGEATIEEILTLDTSAVDAAKSVEDAKKAALDVLTKAKDAAGRLKRLGKPFLNWTGKAERLSFDVPTLPLFVHERLSTKAIIATLKSHEKRADQSDMFELFGDPNRSVADQVLRAYEYKDDWTNRMILGDSLVVMNSLLHYENLGGQVQMIYIDPPYGVKFGSNFQPFVRKRDVSHNDDDDMTREPEMVKAYRDTWELGLHSYLTYMRDRLLIARELLHQSGSIFVQISDENVHHVRELMDEVFGADNFVALIPFRKKTMPLGANFCEQMADFILWFSKQKFDQQGRPFAKYRPLYRDTSPEPDANFRYIELEGGQRRELTELEKATPSLIPRHSRLYRLKSMEPSGPMESGKFRPTFEGEIYDFPSNGYATTPEGMARLIKARRVQPLGRLLNYVLFQDDKSGSDLTIPWFDTAGARDNDYVVRTSAEVVRRCILMTTDPGDLVLDPTMGGGTIPYVAEQWGRRWIGIDISRVPLALARQRLLTASFPYYVLQDEARGPAGGFKYSSKRNQQGQHIGGIRPYVTLSSIANNESAQEQVLVDLPDQDASIIRVCGPFSVDASIPSPIDLDGDGIDDSGVPPEEHASFLERMLEVLRKSPVLSAGGGKTVTLRNIRPSAKSLTLSAEAIVDADGKSLQSVVDAAHEANTGGLPLSQRPVAILFGPESGAVSDKLIASALKEASAKNFSHLYVIGFAIQAHARETLENAEVIYGISSTYVTATHDLMMGDLLKTTRASQIFSVCGMPDVKIHEVHSKKSTETTRYQVELLGFDVFDPVTMELVQRKGDDVPAWLLDTDYNGLVFHGSQVFFPRTAAWDGLKRALKSTHEGSVWDHLAGTRSAPFEAGEHGAIAVKVIDDRGNELLLTKRLVTANRG